jgi:hypothetical protein
LPETYLKDYFWFETWKNVFVKQENINLLRTKYKDIWYFIKSFVESYSEKEDILLLIDEYDKPVNDCLKYKKHELECKKEVLEELKDKLYRYLKDIPCITIITGINKLSMASFFSDFNNLSDYSKIVSLWYSQEELEWLFKRLEVEYKEDVKKWYNWYRFSKRNIEYNPWAINKYLESEDFEFSPYWSKTWTAPDYFRYLIKDILKVKNFEEYLDLIKEYKYTDKIINLETMNELNIPVILHYFYYAWLLTITEESKFAIPNNDVLYAYEDLIFANTETENYVNLRNKATDALEYLEKDTKYLKEFIEFLLHYKYVNQDKNDLNKLWEQVLTSDVYMIYKTFARLDLRREVNLLEWRTDLEYIDYANRKILYEFKVARESKEIEEKIKEAREQIERSDKWGKYDRKYIIVIDLEKIEIKVIEED